MSSLPHTPATIVSPPSATPAKIPMKMPAIIASKVAIVFNNSHYKISSNRPSESLESIAVKPVLSRLCNDKDESKANDEEDVLLGIAAHNSTKREPKSSLS
uniref:Isoleucine--tRNA ligase n=1 Tax=Lygus hesperus TaxID=30085 RepID=A0A0A9WZ88_LYGHE